MARRDASRFIHDRFDPERRVAKNNRTMIWQVHPAFERFVRRDLGGLFVQHFDAIREACRQALEPGVVLIAVDGLSGAVGHVSLRARTGQPNAAVVGRHGQADLRLHRDGSVALRHVAAITLPLQAPGDRPRVLLVDLQTTQGFEDERGVSQRAVLAEGPVLARVGRYVLFVLPSDLARELPGDGQKAWERLPRRVYLEQLALEAASEQVPGPSAEGLCYPAVPEEDVSRITRVPAPRPLQGRMLEQGEDPLGELEVATEDGRIERIALGASALRRGVLVGRYSRCATSVVSRVGYEGVSRVHVLLLQLEGTIWAFDTASTNGTRVGDEEVRVARVEPGLELELGTDAAWATWRVLKPHRRRSP